jgi:aldose 1-epimerase
MDIITSEPALQVYLGCHLTGIPGRAGGTYGPGDGICLETVRFPDSTLLPELPTIVLAAGNEYVHHTTYRFTTQ